MNRVHGTRSDNGAVESVTGGTVCGKTARTGLWGSRWETAGSTRICTACSVYLSRTRSVLLSPNRRSTRAFLNRDFHANFRACATPAAQIFLINGRKHGVLGRWIITVRNRSYLRRFSDCQFAHFVNVCFAGNEQCGHHSAPFEVLHWVICPGPNMGTDTE